MPNREHYVKCFLAGGLTLGILSGIPGIEALNCFCCAWVVLGGGLAGYLLVRWSSYQVSQGEGALVGLLSGVLGAVISSILNALRWMVMGEEQIRMAFEDAMSQAPPDMPPGFEEFMERMTDLFANPELILLVGLMFSMIIFSVFGMIGGLLAVTIWGPRKFPPHGQPPAYYPPGTTPPPSVYIPPPVMPQPQPPPPVVPPESNRFPGSGQGPSGPVSGF